MVSGKRFSCSGSSGCGLGGMAFRVSQDKIARHLWGRNRSVPPTVVSMLPRALISAHNILILAKCTAIPFRAWKMKNPDIQTAKKIDHSANISNPHSIALGEFSRASRFLDIKAIAESPLFAHRVTLAPELGLLTPLLAGDLEAVAELASELIAALSDPELPEHQRVLFRQEEPVDSPEDSYLSSQCASTHKAERA